MFGGASSKPALSVGTGGSSLFGNNNLTTPSKPASGGFSFGANTATPANNSSSGGLFGSSNNAGQSSTGGLFGNTNNSTASGGLFGNKPATGGLFGNSTANTSTNTANTGGLFGNAANNNNTNANTNQYTGGLFGNTNNNNTNANSNTGGLFGNTANNNTTGGGLFGNKPATGGLFGNNTNNNSTNTNTGGLFGNKSTTSNTNTGGLFGNSNNSSTNSGGLFGNNSNTNSGGLFGNNNNSNTNSGGLFGNNNNSNTNTGGLFGNKPATGGGLFANNNTSNASGGGLFANNNTSNASGGLFGSNQQQLQQQQQQQLPPITLMTRVAELPQGYQNELKQLNDYINRQMQICETLKLEQKKHEDLVNSIPKDIIYLSINYKKVNTSLLNDLKSLDGLKDETRELIKISEHFILFIHYLSEGGSSSSAGNDNVRNGFGASRSGKLQSSNSKSGATTPYSLLNGGLDKKDALSLFNTSANDSKTVVDISLTDRLKSGRGGSKDPATMSLISSSYLITFFQRKLIEFNDKFHQLNSLINDIELSFNEIEKNSSDLLLSYGFLPNAKAGENGKTDASYDLNSLINNNLKNLMDSINEEFYLFMDISNQLAGLHYEIKLFS